MHISSIFSLFAEIGAIFLLRTSSKNPFLKSRYSINIFVYFVAAATYIFNDYISNLGGKGGEYVEQVKFRYVEYIDKWQSTDKGQNWRPTET